VLLLIQYLESLLSDEIQGLGCTLWGIEYLPGRKRSLLRVYIDKQTGVTLDDCTEVSRHIGNLLDVENPISGHYHLEVSSPGIERLLLKHEHYRSNIGNMVRLELWEPADGRRKFKGRLQAATEDELTIADDEQAVTFTIPQIRKIRLLYEY